MDYLIYALIGIPAVVGIFYFNKARQCLIEPYNRESSFNRTFLMSKKPELLTPQGLHYRNLGNLFNGLSFIVVFIIVIIISVFGK